MDKKDFMPTKKDNRIIFLITYTVVLVVALMNINSTLSLVGWAYSILSPFIIGLVIAYIINIIMVWLETKVFVFLNKKNFKLWNKLRRLVCMTLAFLIIIAVCTVLVLFIVPQLAQSIKLLSANMPAYIAYLQQTTNNLLAIFGMKMSDFGGFAINWNDLFEKLTSFVANISPEVLNFATNFTSMVFNFFMGIIFAIYMLLGKENILSNIKRTLFAYLPEKTVGTLVSVSHEANKIFTSFVVGQLTEAVILGVMYFIGTSILRMPYSLLISSMMAVFGLIPMFGPIIGAVVSAFILLMVDINLALIFIVMAVIFQQIEGNIIYPRVMGSSVGLPGIWVLFAILVGGNLFGAFGMILSVPIASLIYSLLRTNVQRRMQEKIKKPSLPAPKN